MRQLRSQYRVFNGYIRATFSQYGAQGEQTVAPHDTLGRGKALPADLKSRSYIFQEVAMIGYITLGTNDLERARKFYDALLAEMGVKRLMEFGDRGSGWAASLDQPMLCIFKPYDGLPATVGNGVMAGISVDSRETVDRMHKKALELGGTDEGKPGLRDEGGEGFYAAYFRDLDGNKLDVFCYS